MISLSKNPELTVLKNYLLIIVFWDGFSVSKGAQLESVVQRFLVSLEAILISVSSIRNSTRERRER